MRPKDLKAFFNFKSCQPILKERILFVPGLFKDHGSFSLPKWEHPELFGNGGSVCVEYCSGNGDWIAQKAKEFPNKNWVAVEMRTDRVQKIWSKIKNFNLSNLIVICAEAKIFSRFYIPDDSVDEVYINFPDPWPKRRHEKHRLMHAPFIEELARILKPHKEITLVTDEHEYLKFALKRLLASPRFFPKLSAPYHETQFENYGTSWFESLWRGLGKEIYYTKFIKV